MLEKVLRLWLRLSKSLKVLVHTKLVTAVPGLFVLYLHIHRLRLSKSLKF